ncbi:MAG: exo-rhamnogalacturonan lyase family protein, partial [Kiritimatiellia bacterium]
GDRMKGCTMAIVTLALTLDLKAAVVTLKVRELAGVPRQAEPVTCGVPFPQGRIKTVDHLALNRGDGASLSASFTVINRWPTDGSIRWALFDALISVPAGGMLDLDIVEAQFVAPAAGVNVQDDVNQITVNTGKINFSVRKKGFRLFESLSLEGKPVLATCPEGLAMTIAGKRYTSAADEQSAVMIEEQNPMRVTIVARGKLSGPGQDKYDYEIRIHAFAGSPLVKLVPTIVKKYGPPRVVNHTFEDLSVTFKLVGQPPWNYVLGSDTAPVTGHLAAGQSAHVLVRKSTEWVFGGAASGGGNPKEDKPLGLGWASLTSDTCGLAVGVHRFWQTFPKAIVLSGDGTLEVGLYPKLMGKGQQFFTGMARTHEIWL